MMTLTAKAYEHSRSMRVGDFVQLRTDCGEAFWFGDFRFRYGPGPFLVIGINNIGHDSASVLLGDMAGNPIRIEKNNNDPASTGTWYFAHFFVRNNFLGAVHKAITCNPSPSEP